MTTRHYDKSQTVKLYYAGAAWILFIITLAVQA